jgi:dinuclear metal center YbgI/SA1388 family protein
VTTRTELDLALSSVAPLHLAEPWDNTGWIIDLEPREVSRLLLTIDLTQGVFLEAQAKGVDVILAYHPPIFSGLKRLSVARDEERLLVELIRQQISVYSPHTALDAASGGMTEWLGSVLGPASMQPVTPSVNNADHGTGRIVTLENDLSLDEVVQAVKARLALTHLRVSEGVDPGRRVRKFAVCPGAGGSVFERVGEVDLLITGEMRHHDVLSRKRRGTHVLLTEHSNSERAYLPLLAARLKVIVPDLEVLVSQVDRDPLRVV